MTIDSYLNRFHNQLTQYCEKLQGPSPILIEAIRYSLQAGGKRLRPLLVYAGCHAVQGNLNAADKAALAIEMIHTFSLIHDDLPAMDDDDYRRGKLTNHKVFGEAVAILAGDALQMEAILLISSITELPSSTIVEMIQALTIATGQQGMTGGQAIDCTQNIDKALALTELEQMHSLKTGALIEAAIILGALCSSSCQQSSLSQLKLFAQKLGLIFQIQDDLLDLTGNLSSLGKNPQQDQKLGKHTYPSLLGLEQAQAYLQTETKALKEILAQIPQACLLKKITENVINRNA